MKWHKGMRATNGSDVDAWGAYRKALFTRNINRAKQLRKARIAAELTQVEVADGLGISGPAYWAWESGMRDLSNDVVNAAIKSMTRAIRKQSKAS